MGEITAKSLCTWRKIRVHIYNHMPHTRCSLVEQCQVVHCAPCRPCDSSSKTVSAVENKTHSLCIPISTSRTNHGFKHVPVFPLKRGVYASSCASVRTRLHVPIPFCQRGRVVLPPGRAPGVPTQKSTAHQSIDPFTLFGWYTVQYQFSQKTLFQNSLRPPGQVAEDTGSAKPTAFEKGSSFSSSPQSLSQRKGPVFA